MFVSTPILLLLAAAAAASMEVSSVRAEPNLEKRSVLAMTEAEEQLSTARKFQEAGKIEEFRTALKLSGDMLELCYKSLEDTGKRARRDPRWFKRAEQKLMVLLRRIDGLVRDVQSEDRPAAESLQKRAREIHDQLIHDIMSRK